MRGWPSSAITQDPWTGSTARPGRGDVGVQGSPGVSSCTSPQGRYYFCGNGRGYAITPDGNYKALSYLQGTITVPLGFMQNPVFFIGRVYAIHGGEPVPWYPDSHGCVRIYDDAVSWFHKDVTLGVTHIYIRGTAP